MPQILCPESLLRVVTGLLLALLAWQGKTLCDRVQSLERNQIRIMVKLGIEPIALESRKKPGPEVLVGPDVTNQGYQKAALGG